MELRNKEMHFHQMEREGPLHDKKNCQFCKMEYKQKQAARNELKEKRLKR